jgi:hypothetical protein
MVVRAAIRGLSRGMTMRVFAMCLGVLGVSACAPEVPDSGVGFGDYNAYYAQREAQLNGTVPPGPPPVTGFDPARVGAAINAAEQGTGAPLNGTQPMPLDSTTGALIGGNAALAADRPRGNAPAGIVETTSEMAGAGGISDEQDFNAVSARETIESDAQRIARNKSQYQVIQPTALPTREDDTGPNIVQFAVSTTNGVGEQVYSRSAIHLGSAASACRRYQSPDLAQEAFLKAGGPERDPKGLDPDGDGFACAWDPLPFRTALQ